MNDLLAKLNEMEYVEVTFEELKVLEQHPRVVAIDFTGFIVDDMDLFYEVQVTAEGTTKESEEWDVTIYSVYAKAYKGL